MSEKGEALSSERHNNYWRSSLMSLGFTAAIGAHSISKEVEEFYPLWFPQRKFFVFLVSCDCCCACYSLG